MKAKKVKDLASELIDDLLSDDKTIPLVTSTDSKEQPPTQTSGPVHDETVKIGESKIIATDYTSKNRNLNFDQSIRTSVGGKFAVRPGSSTAGLSTDAALVQSENLRVAQQRIFELEQEMERLRRENEQLAAAGETIKKRADELIAENEFKTQKLNDLQERAGGEKEILETSLKAKDREVKELRMKIEEYEMRLSTNLQKIRVRERELENRLELVKMESTAVVRSKDEMILDLKRQIDQSINEIENFRNKGHDLNRQISEKQETLRRTVKALRLALSMLEGSADESDPLKKAK